MGKVYVSFKEVSEGERFPYKDFGYESHGRRSFRLWIAGSLLKKDEHGDYIEFPLKNAKVFKTKKGNLVLRPAEGYVVYDLFIPCGYRGESKIEILEPKEYERYDYYEFRSPRGSLGVSQGTLVCAKSDHVKYKWRRSGRLYGDEPSGVTVINAEGKKFDIIDDDEILNMG